MSATENNYLLDRIMAFELDAPGALFPFTARLAREQGWTHVFAGRVVTEYKHFVALAMLAGHPVTPSEQVDQVWHLHLVYTRSYWHGLCNEVLGCDLHHGPTAGGTEENDKFTDWYQKTLDSYRRLFGHAPPPDIWPDPARRFARSGSSRWVDASAFWLIPKPAFLRNFLKNDPLRRNFRFRLDRSRVPWVLRGGLRRHPRLVDRPEVPGE